MPFVPNHMVGAGHGRTHDRFFSVPSIIFIEVAKINTSITIVEGIY